MLSCGSLEPSYHSSCHLWGEGLQRVHRSRPSCRPLHHLPSPLCDVTPSWDTTHLCDIIHVPSSILCDIIHPMRHHPSHVISSIMCDIIHVTSFIPCGVDHSCVTSSAPCDIMPTPCDTTIITIIATLCWATHPGQPRPSSIIVSRAAEEPQCWAGRVPGTSLFPGLLNHKGPSQLRASLLRGGFVAQTSSHTITALPRGKRNPPALS